MVAAISGSGEARIAVATAQIVHVGGYRDRVVPTVRRQPEARTEPRA
jgi:hypothetical protein